MYIYANVGGETQVVESFMTTEELLSASDWPDSHLVDAVDETWIQRKKWDAETQQFIDLPASESINHNSLEYPHIDSNGVKHWLDVFINDLAEDVGNLDASNFAAVNHTHSYAGSSSTGGAATSANKLNTNAGSVAQPVYFSNGVPVATTYALNKTVPSDAVFTDTVYTHPSYTARTGVPTANATLSHGGTFTVTQPTSDATGHITAMNTRTYTMPSETTLSTGSATATSTLSHSGTFTAVTGISVSGHKITPTTTTYTLPSDNNTDTKVTNTLATTTKAYVTGTTSASTNTGTQVFDTGVYLDTTAGQLTASTFNGSTFKGSGVATLAEVKTYLGI